MPLPKTGPSISCSYAPDDRQIAGAEATIDVYLQGVVPGQPVELTFIETDATDDKSVAQDRVLGTAKGRVAAAFQVIYKTDVTTGERVAMSSGPAPFFSFIPAEPPPPAPTDGLKVAFRFSPPSPFEQGQEVPDQVVYIWKLVDSRWDNDEGDWWEVVVQAKDLGCESQPIPIARVRRQLETSAVTYDWHDGHNLKLYQDASEDDKGTSGAFFDLLQAVKGAKHFVFVSDWSFHPLARLGRTNPAHPADTIGALLIRLAMEDPERLIAIQTWDHTQFNNLAPDPQNDEGGHGLDSIARGLGLPSRPTNLLWQASSREGVGWSHHQKFVVLDCPASDGGGRRALKVFFGGLDLTKGRFDWKAHVVSPKDKRSWPFLQHWNTLDNRVTTNDWYNAEFGDEQLVAPLDVPRQPWHDIHASIEGPSAWDFVREFVGRWFCDPSIVDALGDDSEECAQKVWAFYKRLRSLRGTFVQQDERAKAKGTYSVQVYRSIARSHWAPPDGDAEDLDDSLRRQDLAWTLEGEDTDTCERSILAAYQQAIDQAERFIYIENQYFIGSGDKWGDSSVKNDLPERIVNRILDRKKAGKPFHAYIVLPMFSEGVPVSSGAKQVRKNEWLTIQYMITTLEAALGEGWSDYLSFHFLANWSTRPPATWNIRGDREERVRAHDRYMVYVHSKFMIVDDRFLILGSANLNERSLAGDRDTEIACGVWPDHGQDKPCIEYIRKFRVSLWKEHFGTPLPGAQEAPESAICVSAARKMADANYRAFRAMATPAVGFICRWPFGVAKGRLRVKSKGLYLGPEAEHFMPDSPDESKKWLWASPGAWFTANWAE